MNLGNPKFWLGGKCGCTTCKGNNSPGSRAGWKGLKNKKGRMMGRFNRK